MRKSDKESAGEQKPPPQLRLPLRELVREALLDTLVVPGLEFVGEVLEEERTALCGPRYQHDSRRQASRAGSVMNSMSLGGRRIEVERPRACSIDGRELSLPSWRRRSGRDPLEQRAMEQMLAEASPRRYTRSLELLPTELKVRGIGKSAASERFVVGTARRLATLMQRKLGGRQLVAVMIDGAKALRRAIADAFGSRAPIQRCRDHKKRNVADALPERMRGLPEEIVSDNSPRVHLVRAR